ncbi:MAG: hypothetical protein EGQ73_01655 [Clostridiales bacterium]|nr:hypothetical protein [Clostridiales bacterium]
MNCKLTKAQNAPKKRQKSRNMPYMHIIFPNYTICVNDMQFISRDFNNFDTFIENGIVSPHFRAIYIYFAPLRRQ